MFLKTGSGKAGFRNDLEITKRARKFSRYPLKTLLLALTPGEQKYSGIIVRQKNFGGKGHAELRNEPRKPVTTPVDAVHRGVGNDTGHSILSILKRLELKMQELQESGSQQGSIEKLQEDLRELQERMLPLCLIRAKVLDVAIGNTSKESRNLTQRRNAAAHGGNVLEDCLLIEEEPNLHRAAAWGRSFQLTYGCQLSQVKSRIQRAAPEIIEVFNMHGGYQLP